MKREESAGECALKAVTMATMQATPHRIVPLYLSGNTTEQQNRLLREFLGDAVQEACRTAIELNRFTLSRPDPTATKRT